jgi:signal transduction histidine kinase
VYDKLNLVPVAWGHQREAPPSVYIASAAEAQLLGSRAVLSVPSDDYLQWIDPSTFFGAERALVVGRETVVGGLLVLVVPYDSSEPPPQDIVAIVTTFFDGQLLTYIDNALLAIDLDGLTAEVGHLMGRAIGKIAAGVETLEQILEDRHVEDELLSIARNSVHDGLIRLDLIRSNFYTFSAQRRGVAGDTESDQSETFDVVRIVRELRPLIEREALDRDLERPSITLPHKTTDIVGSAPLFRLVLLNLYDNAIKFAYAHTFIKVVVVVNATSCTLTIENLGIGVAPDETSLVFQRRYRSRFRDPHRRIEGLGLGLSYCRRVVVEVLKGSISLASRSVGTSAARRFEGDNWLTTVTVALPLRKVRE